MKRNWFRGIIDGLGCRDMAFDPVTGFYVGTRFFGLLVDEDMLAGNQCGRQRARTAGKLRSNNSVQPSAGIGFLDNNGKGTNHEKVAEVGLIFGFGAIRNKQRFQL